MIFKEDMKLCIYRGYLNPGALREAPTTNQPHDLMFSTDRRSRYTCFKN